MSKQLPISSSVLDDQPNSSQPGPSLTFFKRRLPNNKTVLYSIYLSDGTTISSDNQIKICQILEWLIINDYYSWQKMPISAHTRLRNAGVV